MTPWTTLRRTATALVCCLMGVVVPAAANAATVIVDNDRAQCPNATFTSVQAAVDAAAAYDTVAICDGTYTESAPSFEPATGVVDSRNGLLIRKNLRLKGTGADKVVIQPTGTTALGGTGTPALLDGGGNVVTVARQTLGSTDEEDISVTFSGLTIASPNADADAGVMFFNASGKVVDSVVGPLLNATSGGALGWGVVAGNSYLGTNPPTETAPKRRVAVDGSLITGYAAGGIRIDGATQTNPTTRSGIVEIGEISDTVVDGGAQTMGSRTGIELHSGARGFVTGSRIANNLNTVTPRSAVGVLLTDADIPNVGVEDSNFGPNGYGLYNASADNLTVRTGARVTVRLNFLGPGGPIADGSPSTPTREAVSGPDVNGSASVSASPYATEPVAGVRASGPRAAVDAAPAVKVTDPVAGSMYFPDAAFDVTAAASDDFDIASVTVYMGDTPVGTDTTPPYAVPVTIPAGAAGTKQSITAVATDSSGQTAADTTTVAVAGSSVATSGRLPGATATPAPVPGTPAAASPAIGAVSGLPKGKVNARTGFSFAITALNTSSVTVRLGTKAICTDTAAPFRCAYLPTVSDVGGRTLSIVATGAGGSAALAIAIKVTKFTGAKLKLKVSRGKGSPFAIVTGKLTPPARLTKIAACKGAGVELQRGATVKVVKLTAGCSLPRTKLGGTGSQVSATYMGNAKSAPAATVKGSL